MEEYTNPSAPKTKIARNRRHWRTIRSLLGGLDPQVLHWNGYNYRQPLQNLLKIEDGFVPKRSAIRRICVSHDIGHDVRRAADQNLPLLSAFKLGRFDMVYSGWEIDEHRHRQEAMAAKTEKLRAAYAQWDNEGVEADRLRQTLNLINHEYGGPAELRPRSFSGWWRDGGVPPVFTSDETT